MFKLFLSFMCRLGVVMLATIPIGTIDQAPDHMLAFLFGSGLAALGCYALNKLANYIDEKPKKPTPATVVSKPRKTNKHSCAA